MTIYYLIPDLHFKRFSAGDFLRSVKQGKSLSYLRRCFLPKHKPIGGVKVIYQHCLMLKKLGYSVCLVQMGRYKGNFYGYNIDTETYDSVVNNVTASDVVVATEFAPYQGLLFPSAKKIVFVQNSLGVRARLKSGDRMKTYFDIGYDHVMTCSLYCTDYVRKQMSIPATTVTNGIDLTAFHPIPSLRVKNRILAMSRKNPDDLRKIITLLDGSGYEIKVVDGLTESTLIKEYQAADIFLATGYPEGFGLPPLEAMACGCVVVGFTGGGASEFMIDGETALVADDGDVETVVTKLKLLMENTLLKEDMRQRGYEKSQHYSLEATEQQLDSFFKTLI